MPDLVGLAFTGNVYEVIDMMHNGIVPCNS